MTHDLMAIYTNSDEAMKTHTSTDGDERHTKRPVKSVERMQIS
jgi:hypothetical protein